MIAGRGLRLHRRVVNISGAGSMEEDLFLKQEQIMFRGLARTGLLTGTLQKLSSFSPINLKPIVKVALLA